MVDAVAGKAGQIASEQRSIEVMYARLDQKKADAIVASEEAMAPSIDGAESRWARDDMVRRTAGTLGVLELAERSLCFGRIDSADGKALHVGRIGLRSKSGEILLVDWRAEAARPFYAATMASPLGLRRRRHLRVEDRRVVDVSDELFDGTGPTSADVVSDGPLVLALGAARTGRMREAAATLQREQDEIVRSGHRGIMVVDGGPGTGKTIVALHRAAYVLYAFPTIAERGVLVFGPNRRFLAYISDVLPSLGENNVQLATGPDLLGVEATRSESDAVARAKGRRLLAEALARRVRDRQPHGVPLRFTTAHGAVTLDASRVDAARRSALQGGIGHNRGRALFLEHVVDDLVDELEQQTARDMSDFEDELKNVGVDLDRMFAPQPGYAESEEADSRSDGLEIDWDRIRDDLLGDISIDRTIAQVWPRLRADDVLRELLTDPEVLAEAAPELSDEQIDSIGAGAQAGWSRADLPLLDEARAQVDGLPEITYGHVVVDEAQQLSEMEWRMLMHRCPSRSMTIVGDLAQAGPTSSIARWEDALEPFVEGRFTHHTLTVNYRTTAEILEATKPILAQIAPAQSLSYSIRRGEAPINLTVAAAEIDDAVADIVTQSARDHPDELVGIVAATQHARRIESGPLDARAAIVSATDARGLEFDTVIIIDPDEIQQESESGLRDLYVAQTRATKRLITLTITAAESAPSRCRSSRS
ncbi:HelD family protein [Paramicrobacterium agarici]|uniref:DNA helicase IV n=1 Tax=Paramicrobacterium agarici TaxID=630514 RepID=A0A2A9DSX5_9MICO|nr:ATP-binding domain-containing protein [Microbacterium agarici]PFG29255.1 DNA helicase IV [Microbacterium agarici]